MIEKYKKKLSGKYNINVSPKIPIVTDSVTRSNAQEIKNLNFQEPGVEVTYINVI